MTTYKTTENSRFHAIALRSVVQVNLESHTSANIINMFRNVLPSLRNYLEEVKIEFTAFDETDSSIKKAGARLDSVSANVTSMNFVKTGHTLIQVPEGFNGQYNQYLNWLCTDGVTFISQSKELLDNYYRALSIFISSKEAKISSKDNTRMYGDMEKALQSAKDSLASFFNAQSSTALRPLETLFDRSADIKVAGEIAKELNRKRKSLNISEVLKMTESISDLLNLLVESSENEKIPEISGQAISSLAQGALVAAHYIEFVGVLRYRIEEAVNAIGIAFEQIEKVAKD